MPVPKYDSLEILQQGGRARDLLALNDSLNERGLSLTRADAEEILDSRNRALKNQGRIELDTSVTQKLIKRLSDSPNVTRDNFIRTVCDLYETFHFIKNEVSDFIGDEEVLGSMMESFENVCRGSVELLMGKGAEKIIDGFNGKDVPDEAEKSEEEQDWDSDR